MMYKAKVVQNTGIDWKKVKLTLSGGNPNQNNEAPILQTWFLRYGYPVAYGNQNAKMNTIQGKVSGLEVSADKMEESSISNYTTVNENQLNISFDIDIPYDILSNGKAHSVALKKLNYQLHIDIILFQELKKKRFY
jgi:hypothetical protein